MAEGYNTRPRREPAKRFLGLPCERGHEGWRYVIGGKCVQCVWENGRRRRSANPEHHARVNKEWRARNAEKIAAYKQANRSRISEVGRLYREKNREQITARLKVYFGANLERYRAHAQRRYAMKRAAAGSHTEADVAIIRAAQKNRCGYCRCKLPKEGGEIDHILPLSKGGSNDRKNLQLLCVSCNRSKGARDPIEHAQRIGMLL